MPSIVTTEGDTAGSIVWVEDVLVFGTDTYIKRHPGVFYYRNSVQKYGKN